MPPREIDRTVFVTFGTPAFGGARERYLSELKRFGATTVMAFTPLDPPVVRAHAQNREIFAEARGYGCWLWKPYIIEAALDAAAPGALVVYTDIAVAMIATPDRLLDDAATRDVTLFRVGWGALQRRFTRRDAFVLAGADTAATWDDEMANGAFIIIRNTPAGRAFVAAWKTLMRDPRVLTDRDNTQGLDNLPDFIAHRHDQSVLSILATRHGIPLLRDPSQFGRGSPAAMVTASGREIGRDLGEVFDHHRRRDGG